MNPTERAKKLGKLFKCSRCNQVKKTKFIGGFQSLDKMTGPVHPVCKHCLKQPEVIPTPSN